MMISVVKPDDKQRSQVRTVSRNATFSGKRIRNRFHLAEISETMDLELRFRNRGHSSRKLGSWWFVQQLRSANPGVLLECWETTICGSSG